MSRRVSVVRVSHAKCLFLINYASSGIFKLFTQQQRCSSTVRTSTAAKTKREITFSIYQGKQAVVPTRFDTVYRFALCFVARQFIWHAEGMNVTYFIFLFGYFQFSTYNLYVCSALAASVKQQHLILNLHIIALFFVVAVAAGVGVPYTDRYLYVYDVIIMSRVVNRLHMQLITYTQRLYNAHANSCSCCYIFH